MYTKEAAIAITNLVVRKIAELAPQVFVGVVIAVESVDSNLFQVQSGNDLFRYVPKATSDTIAVDDTVLLIKGIGTPMIIVGEIHGDITLAQV